MVVNYFKQNPCHVLTV